MESRNKAIDIVKGIGIILMIMGHCSLFGPMRYIIFSFHMPLFFIFSGYFFRTKPWNAMFCNGFKRLIIPYSLAAIATLLIFYFLGLRDFSACVESFVFAHGGPKETWLFPTHESVGPVWFLMALFCCRIYYQIIFIACKQREVYAFVASFLISCIAVFIGRKYINLPFGMITGLSAVGFYAFGVFVRHLKSYYLIGAFIVVWIVAVVLHKATVDMVNFNYSFYPVNFITAIGGTMFAYSLSLFLAKLRGSDFLASIGVCSLDILCIHQVMHTICRQSALTPAISAVLELSVPIILALLFRRVKTKS